MLISGMIVYFSSTCRILSCLSFRCFGDAKDYYISKIETVIHHEIDEETISDNTVSVVGSTVHRVDSSLGSRNGRLKND